MGVHGLWRLIEPSGKTVPLETLENKVLAVDISIWLHQAIKGFQDSKGAPLPNAHLLGIYHRVCKLLYFKIKPVFVFDGGVPVLKKQTIAKRNQLKSRNQSEADRLQKQLLSTLLKHSAIANVLSEKTKAGITSTKVSPVNSNKDSDNLFALPSTSMDSTISSSDEEMIETSETTDDDVLPSSQLNIHNIDTESKDFKCLPADVRYEILSEVKETRKQSSWGRLHQLPTESNHFSTYQMNRLLQRQNVQSELEKTQKEMGGHSLSLAELEGLLNDQGVITKNDTVGKRIASDENTRFLLIKDVKQAIEEAEENSRQKALEDDQETNEKVQGMDKEKLKALLKKKFENASKEDQATDDIPEEKPKTIADLEYEEDLERAIQLSLECIPENNEDTAKNPEEQLHITPDETFDSAYTDEDSDCSDAEFLKKLSSAQSYMMEYSGLTPAEIARILKKSSSTKKSNKATKNISKTIIQDEYNNPSDKPKNASRSVLQKLDKISEITEVSEIDKIKECATKIKEAGGNSIQACETMNIVINPNEAVEDDLFSDVLSDASHSKNTSCQEVDTASNMKPITEKPSIKDDDKQLEEKKHIEIVINPNETVDDDLFKDVFEDITTKQKKINEKVGLNKPVKISASKVQEIGIISSDSDESDDDFVEVDGEPSECLEENLQLIKKAQDNSEKEIITSLSSNTHVALKMQETIEVISKKATELNDDKLKQNQSKTDLIDTGKEEEIIVDNASASGSINKSNRDVIKTTCHNDIEAIENVKSKPIDKTIASINAHSEKVNEEHNKEGGTKADSDTVIVDTVDDKQSKLTITQLQELKEDLRQEQFKLQTEKSLKERLAGNISDQMYQEAQELLELFGMPYVIAPMEAEAQCAYLDAADLTDGTITDDSDIWLFGGKTVYKNFFNQSKHVMEFRAENISHHFKLSREQMILLALLVGSDYTTGLQGIGPVTALEILAAFPPASTTEFSITHNQLLSGLADFRNWFRKGKAPELGRKGLRSKLKNVQFSENFPSIQVVEAYLEPTVDSSREPFTWAKPDFVGLVDFARQKFGWTIRKSEEILNPVIKRLEEKHIQKTIRDYFKTNTRVISNDPENRMSKRVKTAVKRIGNGGVDEEEEAKPKQKRSRKKKADVGESSTKDQTSTDTKNFDNSDKKEKQDESEEGKSSDVTNKEGKSDDKIQETEKPKRRGRKNKIELPDELAQDEDVKILEATATRSSKRVREINAEVEKAVKDAKIKKAKAPNLHKKEFIPQRERDKAALMRNKLKAIEIFRKSQQGPGYVKKRMQMRKAPKIDAELSEDSSDES